MVYELVAVFTADKFIIDKEVYQGKKESDAWYDEELLLRFDTNPFESLYDFGFSFGNQNMSPSLGYLKSISEQFIHALAHDSDIEITRKAREADNQTLLHLLHLVPFANGVENIDFIWLRAVWTALGRVFDTELASYDGSVSEYLKSKDASINVVGRVYFHLVEHKSDAFPFAFLATYSTGDAQNVTHLPLKNALLEHKSQQDKLLALLSTVSKAADKSDFISQMVESGEIFSPLRFSAQDAYLFLREIELYEECGIVCRIPNWWRRKNRNTRLSISIGDKEPGILGLDTLLSFRPTLFLGDTEMTQAEVESLLEQSNGLSFIKGKWVEVDHDRLRAALAAFKSAQSLHDLTFADAMRMQMGIIPSFAQESDVSIEITNGQWLKSFLVRMKEHSAIEPLQVGEDFCAQLRPYQYDGFQWLNMMRQIGFGCLLADDMGLGKTVQILAVLDYLRQNDRIKALLIIPTSLIHNWQREADRFAPQLRYRVIHTQNREFTIDEADLFITTYGMAVRLESLSQQQWDLVILDEAQAIKTPGSKQTKAVKMLPAKTRVAMTGTPIENRLSDLWSIFDFLNKGLLGSSKEFTVFSKTLADNATGYAKLREVVNPFILRRLKTDKSIIKDLPDKVEVKAFTQLSKKQTVLYNGLVDDLKSNLEKLDGMARRGVVLASIMKFKQICNHPDQYMGQQAYEEKYSGKFEKLAEICEIIRAKRERVLVFTQFREIVEPLSCFLQTIFERDGLVLHGGTSVKKRGQLVERFNGEEYVPFMVLSLKAGGVGLNLTAANHVIHFDRWWNPAVENQATDRAFRIGQQKNVMVHKFITTGTIEEKIDLLLESKQQLSEDVIAASGENWITEMSNEELFRLFSLEEVS